MGCNKNRAVLCTVHGFDIRLFRCLLNVRVINTMARIYISHSHKDKELAAIIARGLRAIGNDIFIDSESLQAGSDWRSTLSDSLKQSDVFLVLLTENSINSNYVISEIGAARAYVNSASNEKLFIPIIFGRIDVPPIIQDIQAIFGEISSPQEVISQIRRAVDAFFGRKAAAEQEREERKQQIEQTAANYIDEAIQQLKERENSLGSKANVWNIIGWGSLIVGVAAVIALVILGVRNPLAASSNWPEVSFMALKSIMIVTLLVASSKYAFSLAKSYMVESLKNADRIHAISFGKFFLQAFGDKVDVKEVKEVFQHWNINNSSSFSSLDADKFDPKIIEAILSIAEVVKKDAAKPKPKNP